MPRKRKARHTRPVHRQRATSVARLASAVRRLSRRVGRLEGHRRRIGFRARREDVDTEVVGELVEQDDDDEDDEDDEADR